MTSTSNLPTTHRLHGWVVKLLSLACGVAVVSCVFAAVDDGQLLWIVLAFVPALIGYGLWKRRRWGRTLALFVCWLVALSPPFLFIGALLGGRGRDSIGHGLVAVMSVAWLFTLTPLAGAIMFGLTRPTACSLFTPADASLSRIERTFVSVSLGVLLLAEIVVLANVHWFAFVLKLLQPIVGGQYHEPFTSTEEETSLAGFRGTAMKKKLFFCVVLVLVSLEVLSWVKVFSPIHGLTAADPKVRQRAVEDMATSWVPDRVARLTAALEDAAVEVRIAAACALGSIGGEAAIAPLIDALQDEDARVRAAAALAMQQVLPAVRDPARRARAIGPLIAVLKEDDKSSISYVFHILVEIGEPAVEPLLRSVLEQGGRSFGVAAVREMIGTGENAELARKVMERLIAQLEEGNSAAAFALGQVLSDVESSKTPGLLTREKIVPVPLIGRTLRLTNILRKDLEVIEALGRILAALKSAELPQTALPPLSEALQNRRQPYRFYASQALVRIVSSVADPQFSRQVVPLLITALQDKDASVREHAAEAFGSVFSAGAESELAQQAAEPLVAALEDKNTGVRNRAACALVKIGTEQAKNAVRNAGFDPARPPTPPTRDD